MTTQPQTFILSPSSELLLLIDEDHFSPEAINSGDLYDELVRQPKMTKQQSLKYDYQPISPPIVYSTVEPQSSVEEGVSDNASEKLIKCNCSKTKCQKNYCQCFKAGRACSEQCSCIDCCNDEVSRITVIPKRNSGSGCKCQKSHCKKNYCECHSMGRKCTEECQCVQCHNIEMEEEIEKSPRKKYKKEMVKNM